MAKFVGLYMGSTDTIFDTKTEIQVRVTQEDKEAFDSFNQGHIHTDLYVLIAFDQSITPNYQIPLNTTIEDATHLDEAYCHRCSDRKQEAIQAEAWFRSSKRNEMRTLCLDCANKLMECKNYGLDQVSPAEIVEKMV